MQFKYVLRHYLRVLFRRPVTRVGKALLILDPADAKVSPSMCLPWPLKFEWREQKVMRSVIRPGDTVVDVGAHIGYHLLLMAQLVGSEGKVYGFEPSERNFQFLEMNVRLNRLSNVISDQVTLKQCALWDTRCDKILYVSEQNTGNCTLSPQANRQENVVHCERLDDILKNEPIHFLKMDVEGAERHVLRGATETLARSPNLKVLVEVNPPYLKQMGTSGDELLQILQANGFRLFEMDNPRQQLRVSDVIRICDSSPDRYANLLCVKGGNP